jgi:hypothetical protein
VPGGARSSPAITRQIEETRITVMTHVRSWSAVPFAILLVCSLLSAQQTSSQSAVVPRLMNFSGKAIDAQGKTISGIAGVSFAIYKDESGGSPLWLETQNIQADAKGHFSVQLGATKPEACHSIYSPRAKLAGWA